MRIINETLEPNYIIRHRWKTRSRSPWGRLNTTKQSWGVKWDSEGLAGRQADNPGGCSGGGRTPGRRTTNRVQGEDDGVRSHGGNRRSQGRSDREEDRRDLE